MMIRVRYLLFLPFSSLPELRYLHSRGVRSCSFRHVVMVGSILERMSHFGAGTPKGGHLARCISQEVEDIFPLFSFLSPLYLLRRLPACSARPSPVSSVLPSHRDGSSFLFSLSHSLLLPLTLLHSLFLSMYSRRQALISYTQLTHGNSGSARSMGLMDYLPP